LIPVYRQLPTSASNENHTWHVNAIMIIGDTMTTENGG